MAYRLRKSNLLLLLTWLLASCDIEPVGIGTWDILIESPNGSVTTAWTISKDSIVTISGSSSILDDGMELEIDMAGSRIFWSTQIRNSSSLPEDASTMNFDGTVNGNVLSGTIYTQLGNRSVSGTRR